MLWLTKLATLATPNSTSLTAPLGSSSTLGGRTSRWTSPSGCSCAVDDRGGRVRVGQRRRHLAGDVTGRPRPAASCRWCAARPAAAPAISPSSGSIATYGSPSSSPWANTRATLGWLSCAIVRASSWNMRTNAGDEASSGRSRLIRQMRSAADGASAHSARYSSAGPPRSTRSMNRNAPKRPPGSADVVGATTTALLARRGRVPVPVERTLTLTVNCIFGRLLLNETEYVTLHNLDVFECGASVRAAWQAALSCRAVRACRSAGPAR